jgi:hypothetical protein
MKKLSSNRRKPAGQKRRARPKNAHFAGRGVTDFGKADIGFIRQLLAAFAPPEEDDLKELIDDLLAAEPDEFDDILNPESLSELEEMLNQTRLDAAGGDIEVRHTLNNIRAAIDDAAARDAIHPAILFVLGRLLADAQIDIGAEMRAAAERALVIFGDSGEEAYRALLEPLLSASDGDPFALSEQIDAQIAVLPLQYKVAFVERLAADPNGLARQAAVGFLLHREEPLARAAIDGLAAAASRGELEVSTRRWIEVVGRWLPPDRQGAIEAAFPSAGRAVPRRNANVVRATASVCDGSGASALSALVKNGSRYTIVSVMVKSTGVAQAMLLEDLPKSETTAYQRIAGSAAPSSEVSLATLTLLLRLALGVNLAHEAPPPFALVKAVEAIGLDTVTPDPATPAEIIGTVLARGPDCDLAETVRQAHESVARGEFADNWFEAGENVEAVLESAQAPGEAASALLARYLPGRRAFWAAQCARSSLALMEGAGPGDETWKHLALVGRDLLGDVPITAIPLMRRIAETSARSYFMQGIVRPAA